jgi:peptidyl-prolyl cis-trans isomerase SurA
MGAVFKYSYSCVKIRLYLNFPYRQVADMISKKAFSVALLVMGVTGFVNSAKAEQPLNRVIASVNNEAITQSQLERKTKWVIQKMNQNGLSQPADSTELQKQVLERLIVERVQLDLAKRFKIDVSDEALQDTINNIAKQEHLTLAQLKNAVAEDGLSFKEFEENIRVELILARLQQQMLADQVVVTNQEVDHFLKSHQQLNTADAGIEYRLRHILLPLSEEASSAERTRVLAEATQLLKRIREGAKFSQLAMDYSKGPQALKGGDLGWRTTDALPTLFVKPVLTLAVGEVAGPIKNDSGYHLVLLEEKRVGGKSVEAGEEKQQRRQQALSTLYEQKFEIVLRRWVKRMRDEAQIEHFL